MLYGSGDKDKSYDDSGGSIDDNEI